IHFVHGASQAGGNRAAPPRTGREVKMSLPTLIPEETAAEYCGWSPRTLREKMKALGIRPIGAGGKYRYREMDIQKLVEAKACPSHSTGAAKSGTSGALFA